MKTVSNADCTESGLDAMMYKRSEKPFGKTWEEWTARWWQWLLSIPKDKNPGNSKDADRIVIEDQNSDVLFLVGNYGGVSNRNYSIPAGKAMLFPIITFETSFTEEPHLKTDDDLKARAKKDIDDIVRKEATIDGIPLENVGKYRTQSEVFDINYPDNNVFQLKPGPTRGISDGYWIFVKPLTSGEHQFHSIGSCLLGKIAVENTWNITVR